MTTHAVDTRLMQIRWPPGVIVAMQAREDVPIPFTGKPETATIANFVLTMLSHGESCDVYAATYQYDAMNMRDLWRRGALLGTLTKEDPTKRRRKRRLVR